ncbi:cytochrome P460 family protein [Cardiobacterium sp. AH-315-I02]|nr:cytochrome P460 family protein [Cardiobacterium sp. AH-315-I02]
MKHFKSYRLGESLLLALVCSASTFFAVADERFSPYVDSNGNISSPEDFRGNMVHLGSWFVPEGAASGFHDVYTEKSTVDTFRKTGKFPDGATLVKELRASKSGDYSTGAGVHHATASVKQWFVMVKDTQNRFIKNPLWGDGWGWALFKPDEASKNVAADYKKDCLGCHIPAKDKDWIYTEAYPTLIYK